MARREQYISHRYRLRRPDGTWGWIESAARIVYSDGGEPLRIVGSMADVTDRIHAEESLKASEARFSAAFRNSPDPMIITRSRDNVHLAANEAAIAMLGWSLEELIGKTPDDLSIFVDHEDRAHIRSGVTRDGIVRNHAAKVRTKSGDIRDLLVTCAMMTIDSEACLLSIARDVTESLKSERRLAEVHAERDAHLRRLRDITDNLPVVIAYSDGGRRAAIRQSSWRGVGE